MADDSGSAQTQSVWPLPKFHFNVKIGDDELVFQEVSGLDMESEPLEYHVAGSPGGRTIRMPGMNGYSNIENRVFTWLKEVKTNVIER